MLLSPEQRVDVLTIRRSPGRSQESITHCIVLPSGRRLVRSLERPIRYAKNVQTKEEQPSPSTQTI